ncbi:enoyl-CoA hydratase-related protein [Sporosarcina obsidiansis]|uniref:enoyl-CoA hydratase-related protein n=1 Tax=Sporosarcina obsidiansis TaxID=2660748 RepID=UPI00129B431A|nr:enoyl-CoA hydratase-related protein [Sporosarcina obsidiansis]
MYDNFLNKLKYFKVEKIYNNKILVVTMNRAPVNAFIKESYLELSAIMNYINQDMELCSMIFNSSQKIFSAGADVKQLAKDSVEEAALRRPILRKSGADFYSCAIPMVVAVNGAAVGAGAVFAACGDIIVAAENAFFSIPEINVGVVGGAKGLSRLLPPQKVRSLALTGGRITAQEVQQYGGVEAVVPENELFETALEYAKTIADKGSLAVRKWKESLLLIESVGPREGLLIEQCLGQELSLLSPAPSIIRN